MKFYNPFKAHIRKIANSYYMIARINLWWPFGFSYLASGYDNGWVWLDSRLRDAYWSNWLENAQLKLKEFRNKPEKIKSEYAGD